jgi:hypothetical protein
MTTEGFLLGYDEAVWFLKEQKFRRNILPPPSGWRTESPQFRLFHPEDGGDMFFRYVWFYKNNTASYLRTQYPSLLPS